MKIISQKNVNNYCVLIFVCFLSCNLKNDCIKQKIYIDKLNAVYNTNIKAIKYNIEMIFAVKDHRNDSVINLYKSFAMIDCEIDSKLKAINQYDTTNFNLEYKISYIKNEISDINNTFIDLGYYEHNIIDSLNLENYCESLELIKLDLLHKKNILFIDIQKKIIQFAY